ncbi:rRNA methyltransferase [Weissella tructae]|uniref:rRNA methylase n=2 Tax=Weissella TaxID=46255 RepID=A0A075TXQ2_9LACO|nr:MULTISPECIES: hypothetical protein [Weissella]AIG64970.1 rRNA methylase [Weissella tructae]AIM62282.1 rRNA methylase [Weissella ceti]AIM63621.1 rRNA methylase [Weissella ceti]ELA07838.1 hypothetical protein WCNC_01122 [Weissella ceti NC36]QVV91382.1 rRNA methyltransferase [Weissella tructae]
MRSVQKLAQTTLDEAIQIGDLTIDATINHGDITRFLASRVGVDGKVLAFSETKAHIDDVATSLFLSGLHERVDLISKPYTAIPNYLDPTTPIGAAIFQIDENDNQETLLTTIKMLLLNLKENGLILLLAPQAAHIANIAEYATKLPTNTYEVEQFTDLLIGETALLLQRK